MKCKLCIQLIGLSLLMNQSIYASNKIIIEVNSLNDRCYDITAYNLDSAYLLAKKAYKISKQSQYLEGEMTALLRIGRIHYKKKQIDSAGYYYQKASEIFDGTLADSIFLAKAQIYQGLVNRKVGKLHLALENYISAYKIAVAKKNKQIIGQCLINVSNLFKSLGKYKEAVKFLLESSNYFSKSDISELGLIAMNLGNMYDLQGRNSEAIIQYKKSNGNYEQLSKQSSIAKNFMNIANIYMKENHLDSAAFYFLKVSAVASKDITSKLYHNQGILFLKQMQVDSALSYFKLALNNLKSEGDSLSLITTYEAIGDAYYIKENYDKSLSFYSIAYSNSNELKNSKKIMTSSLKLAKLYAMQKDLDNALHFMNTHLRYKDSISSSIQNSLVEEINFNSSAYQLSLLNIQNDINKLEESKQKTLMWGALIVCLLTIIIISTLYIYQQQKSFQKQKLSENQQKVDELLNGQEQLAINAMLDGQEKERDRIATDLHDKLGSLLSTVKLYFKSIDKQIDNLKEENIKQYHKANHLLDEACDEVRKISHELSSGVLSKLGLFAAVKNLKEKIDGSGEVKVILQTYGTDEGMEVLNEIAIFRVIQELVGNALKHSEAKEITIQLNVFDELFNLIVEDNGVGFDLKELINNSGIGLRNTEARIKKMNGILTIDSSIGKGSTISIDIPLIRKL